jgi:glycosyltransferase involved in cell wall biosynthesis
MIKKFIVNGHNSANDVAFGVGDQLPKATRVAVLFERFGPYHHARLNAAGLLMSVWGVEACALEDTYAWDKVEGAAAFERVTLTDRVSGDREWKKQLHNQMWRTLEEIKPQVVVVPGWASPDALSALLWCAETDTPAVVMSESTAWDELRSGLKEWIKSRLVKLNSAGLVGGTPHGEYLNRLGLAPERIFFGYDVVDNGYFSSQADEVSKQKADNRKRHGLPEKYFLASARFVEKKNLPRLLKAYARYRELARKSKIEEPESEIWDFVLLGDGPLRTSILELRSSLGLESYVHLPGFKQYDELPVYFGMAGAFVHASTTEQWGLVVNEAMASGLPVLVSNRCGCAQDLVREGVNGFTFDPGDIEQVASLLLRVSAAQFPLADFGIASRQLISAWGPERFANGLRDAVAVALKSPRPRIGRFDRLLLRLLLRR